MSFPASVVIDYTNYRGERSERLILPRRIWFGTTEWHAEPQWLLEAIDLAKDSKRDFAMNQIHTWGPSK